jgi:hypothetical protein
MRGSWGICAGRRGEIEAKDDSPNNLEIMPISPLTQVLKTQDNMEEPEGEEYSTILDATV